MSRKFAIGMQAHTHTHRYLGSAIDRIEWHEIANDIYGAYCVVDAAELTVECTVSVGWAHGSINGHRWQCCCCSCWCCCCVWRYTGCILLFPCKIPFSPFTQCTVILLVQQQWRWRRRWRWCWWFRWLCNTATIANGKPFVRSIWTCISLFLTIKQKWIVVLWHCAYTHHAQTHTLAHRDIQRRLFDNASFQLFTDEWASAAAAAEPVPATAP